MRAENDEGPTVAAESPLGDTANTPCGAISFRSTGDAAVIDHRNPVLPPLVETVDQALTMVERAYFALAEAVDFQSTRQVRNVAVAAAAYAREAKDTRLLDKATELRTRAERKAGQMLREAAARGERATKDGNVNPATCKVSTGATPSTPTLRDIGVTRDQSSKWQQVAKLTDDEFDDALEITKAITHEISTSKVLRAVRQARQKAAPPAMEVGTDDDVVVVVEAPSATPDEQAAAFYNAVRALADITCAAEQLRTALPYYQHFRIAENIGPALTLLQEVAAAWPLAVQRRPSDVLAGSVVASEEQADVDALMITMARKLVHAIDQLVQVARCHVAPYLLKDLLSAEDSERIGFALPECLRYVKCLRQTWKHRDAGMEGNLPAAAVAHKVASVPEGKSSS